MAVYSANEIRTFCFDFYYIEFAHFRKCLLNKYRTVLGLHLKHNEIRIKLTLYMAIGIASYLKCEP